MLKSSIIVLLFSPSVLASELFYFEKKENKPCQVKVLSLPDQSQKTLLSLKTCPSGWVWGKNKSYFVQSGYLWRISKGKKKRLVKMPFQDVEFWVDRGIPHVAYMVPIQEKNVSSKKKSEETFYTYRYKKKTYTAGGLVPWGLPHMAIAAKLSKGKWKQLEIEPTKTAAGDTPGLNVLSTYFQRNKKGRNLQFELSQGICTGELNCEVDRAAVKDILGKAEGYGEAQVKNGGLFVFPVMYGDTPHAVPPVYFCQKPECKKSSLLKAVDHHQISVAVDLKYVLIAGEYSNDHPMVFDGQTGELLVNLPDARSAVWITD